MSFVFCVVNFCFTSQLLTCPQLEVEETSRMRPTFKKLFWSGCNDLFMHFEWTLIYIYIFVFHIINKFIALCIARISFSPYRLSNISCMWLLSMYFFYQQLWRKCSSQGQRVCDTIDRKVHRDTYIRQSWLMTVIEVLDFTYEDLSVTFGKTQLRKITVHRYIFLKFLPPNVNTRDCDCLCSKHIAISLL